MPCGINIQYTSGANASWIKPSCMNRPTIKLPRYQRPWDQCPVESMSLLSNPGIKAPAKKPQNLGTDTDKNNQNVSN